MFKKFNEIRAQRKESGKKGFTLVELIVVLVILAILAALLIPALTGYIEKAKDKQIIAETRQCVMAAQTIADEITGTKDAGVYADATAVKTANTAAGTAGTNFEAVTELAEVADGTVSDVEIDATGKVTKLVYTPTSGSKKCTYENKEYKVGAK